MAKTPYLLAVYAGRMVLGTPQGSSLPGDRLLPGGRKGGHYRMPQSALEYAAKRRQRRKKLAEAATLATGNGHGKIRLLVREQVDGRTKARKQFDAIAEGIARDLGGEDQ